MKKKYFVRGLGIGIIFGALIMLAAYMTSGKTSMSDEEIMKRAEKLGMVKESEYVLNPETDTDAVTKPLEELVQESSARVTTTEAATEETTTEKATTEAVTEETTTEETTTEQATTEAAKDNSKKSGDKATITVSGGMSSETIANLLEDAGLVDSASDFNSFLVQNGYDMKLETGKFEINSGMSYEEIAKILTTKQ